eukprot:CAMPEP_0194748634 /NCGR_PEP_ID=MMETSP0323_2-20130528/2783_1 /TAXON_ID=2866 ORGANISM="Crypthecodinium cohnii, Strain Seligo" /NCGR_SAMPLE_ID=MMETSP0323_2 /ASSEMBLY_ACC=CAM_ASM_000346 /LENGTH=150 /DNA_ID=CAMNT_0039663049 /DNA_START=411 /DNA_END=860 /DNA_ORIENTATION=+
MSSFPHEASSRACSSGRQLQARASSLRESVPFTPQPAQDGLNSSYKLIASPRSASLPFRWAARFIASSTRGRSFLKADFKYASTFAGLIVVLDVAFELGSAASRPLSVEMARNFCPAMSTVSSSSFDRPDAAGRFLEVEGTVALASGFLR